MLSCPAWEVVVLKSVAVALIAAALAAPAQGHAQPREGAPGADVAFRLAYQMSYVSLDWCGDSASGAIFRKALLARFDACPFPGDVKSSFHDWVEKESVRQQAATQGALAHDNQSPDHASDLEQSCAERLHSPDYQQARDQLQRFDRGELPATMVISTPCEAAALP